MGCFRIVIADDHALIRQGLRLIIQGVSDLEVVGEAGDGNDLLSLLDTVTPHMVILDISMPNLRGIEAIHAIKTKSPDVKILVLTMHREYSHQALSTGADGYLLKEDADRDLFSAIENIRDGRIYLSPRLTHGLLKDRYAHLHPQPLSLREKGILKLIAEGKSNKDIAALLVISIRTVESHRASILNKLKLKNTADLVKYAIQTGYL